MPPLPSRTVALPALLGLILVAAACNNDSPLTPFQPEIMNQPGSFQLQATAMKNVSTTLEYPWQNAGTTADVNQATVLTRGTATLVILDDLGSEVYSDDLTNNGTYVTSTGSPGTWTIRVILAGCHGDLNVRVQTP